MAKRGKLILRRYKALLVDIDGTLVGPSLKVSPVVAQAVGEAAQRIPVALVSGRYHGSVADYARSLGLGGLHIVEGGARIFDVTAGISLWRRTLLEEDARAVAAAIAGKGYVFGCVDGDKLVQAVEEIRLWQVTCMTVYRVSPTEAASLTEGLCHRTTLRVVASEMPSDRANLRLVDFTHVDASKGTAALRWAKLMNIASEEMIGVGDTYNDRPLLEVCGLKVVMGGAPQALQELADWVAPPVEEDGLASVIRRYVLAGHD